MINNEELKLLQIQMADTGIKLEDFIASPVGKYLYNKADLEIKALKDDLVEAEPEDFKENIRIRNQISVCKMFIDWIEEGIADGRRAAESLRDQEAAENPNY